MNTSSSNEITIVILALIAGLPALLAAIASFIAVMRNGMKVDRLHETIDGRMEELVNSTGAFNRAEGRAEGVASERANPQSPNTDMADHDAIPGP